jgi:hypothetical protein
MALHHYTEGQQMHLKNHGHSIISSNTNHPNNKKMVKAFEPSPKSLLCLAWT